MSSKINRIATILLVAVFGLGLFSNVNAQEGSANAINAMLKKRDKEIKSLIGSKKKLSSEEEDKLRNVVNDVISFEEMGKAVLGKYWKSINAAQQQEFVDVFGKIVKAQSLADLNPYRAKMTFGDVIVLGSEASAKTKGVLDGVTSEINYVFVKTGAEWKVKDILLDDVSTVKGYSKSFRSVIRKKGFDKLMGSLNKKLAKMEA